MQHIKFDCCSHVLVMAIYLKKRKKKEKSNHPILKRNISKHKCTTQESWISM